MLFPSCIYLIMKRELSDFLFFTFGDIRIFYNTRKEFCFCKKAKNHSKRKLSAKQTIDKYNHNLE